MPRVRRNRCRVARPCRFDALQLLRRMRSRRDCQPFDKGASDSLVTHFAVGFAYLEPDPARAVVSFEEALRYSDLGGSNIVRDRSMHMLAFVAWRAGEMIAAAHHLARALTESFAMGDYSTCASEVGLAVPILAGREQWHAVLVIDNALTNDTLPPGIDFQGIAEARERAVAAARAALADDSPGRDDASRDRDAIIRYAIAELETVAQG